MSESPERKKAKLVVSNELKRSTDSEGSPSKRVKKEPSAETSTMDERVHAKRRNNFIVACQKVSREAYFNFRIRFHLNYIPTCFREGQCRHRDPNIKIGEMPAYAEESFKIEMKTNMWWEALEVCLFSITPNHYLSAEVMKDVVEIMLNAHEDPDETYSIEDILIKCQQILAQNFNAHPPCLIKRIRKCYNNFLTSPMNPKDNTFSNRSEFGCNKGIVKYCLNRLESEMNPELTKNDSPLIDKHHNVPEEMRKTVKGLHWQEEKFEIYEVLKRHERIQRLFMVLDSIIQLLKADLAIWHNRHPNEQSKHMMRSSRPLMAQVLWPDTVLLTGAVDATCRQIMRIFTLTVHYGYRESDVTVMTDWISTMAQTFYFCETNSNTDYPTLGKFCKGFAKEFYKIIQERPECRHKVIEAIQPAFIRHEIALEHVKTFLPIKNDSILETIEDFLSSKTFDNYTAKTEVAISENRYKKPRTSNWLKAFTNKCTELAKPDLTDEERDCYPTTCAFKELEVDIHSVVHALYVAVEAYLETYSVEDVQSKLQELNERIDKDSEDSDLQPDLYPYSTTVDFIKVYRSTYKLLNLVIQAFRKLKHDGNFHKSLAVFKKLRILGA